MATLKAEIDLQSALLYSVSYTAVAAASGPGSTAPLRKVQRGIGIDFSIPCWAPPLPHRGWPPEAVIFCLVDLLAQQGPAPLDLPMAAARVWVQTPSRDQTTSNWPVATIQKYSPHNQFNIYSYSNVIRSGRIKLPYHHIRPATLPQVLCQHTAKLHSRYHQTTFLIVNQPNHNSPVTTAWHHASFTAYPAHVSCTTVPLV